MFTTLDKYGEYTFEVKKSVFIGYAKPCDTEKDALDFVNEIRKKHSDATHNVFAYVIRNGNFMRYSDDGEPSGTAGLPVLDVLRKSGTEDAVVVVTRYFGGTLLGKGGLVKAYTDAAKFAVENAGRATVRDFALFEIKCTYPDYEKIKYELSKSGIDCSDADFDDRVTMKLSVVTEDYQKIEKNITDLCSGRAVVTYIDTVQGRLSSK